MAGNGQVVGISTSGEGVWGQDTADGMGVLGTTETGTGVYGQANEDGGTGVVGTGNGGGVRGISHGVGAGVEGLGSGLDGLGDGRGPGGSFQSKKEPGIIAVSGDDVGGKFIAYGHGQI
jgi:hypothetical protein